jgi:hypothetical protein
MFLLCVYSAGLLKTNKAKSSANMALCEKVEPEE